MESAPRIPIAVVGMGCRFPGGATDPQSFWRLLESGADAIGPLPAGRFDVERFVHPEPGTPGKIVTAEGGFLSGIDQFDAGFFGLSPREARKIDPQHRLLLEVAYEALEDAGIAASSLAGRRVGVYVGVWSGEYENVMYRTPAELDFHSITGGGRYAASGRISYAFDLRGPTLTVDTGCSASLVALHLARQAIESGEADLAIVGAANLVLQPHVNIGYSRSGMLSAGARCRFGDAGAGGYVRSDGAAAVVLKPLAAARADGDPVRGVVLATAVNADGRGSGQLATPSADAQAELLETVYARAGVDPATVPYVEAHGTGTRAGDPVELNALGRVLGRDRDDAAPLIVGSVKTNIGHTEACAGMAGLIKTLLALEHRVIPANLHLRDRSDAIAWADLRVTVPTEAQAWPADAPLIAGVSSFGITGTNAHAVVAAADAAEAGAPASDAATGAPCVVTVSGRTPDALEASVAALRAWASVHAEARLEDVSYTTTCRRDHHEHRLAVVAESMDDLRAALDEHQSKSASARAVAGEASSQRPRIGFVFSGQGSQWLGMGRELLRTAPAFAEAIAACDAVLNPLVGWSVREILLAEDAAPLERVDVIQPTLACFQVAFAEQLRAWGVEPDAVVGHSMGEVAAAFCAGALSLDDAMRVIAVRSRLLAGIAGHGAMALVDLPETEADALLDGVRDRVSIASINGPRSTVLSGDPDIIDGLLERLDDDGVFGRRVRVDVASHSAQTDPLLAPLRADLSVLRPTAGTLDFYSTARPEAPRRALLDAAYWVDNLRRPVRLMAAVQSMIADGIDTFVEVAPHPVLLTSLADIAADADAAIRAQAGPRREEPELRRCYELLARLHAAGAPIAWPALALPGARVTALPRYPWQRERHWLDDWEDWSGDADRRARATWPEAATDWLYEIDWTEVAPQPGGETRTGHWVVIGRTGALRDEVVRKLTAGGATVDVSVHDPAAVRTALTRATALRGIVVLPWGGGPDAGAAAAVTARAALGLMQAIAEGASSGTRIVVVTQSAIAVPGDAPAESGLAQTPLWGLVRVLRDEHPELDARLLDVAIAAQPDEAVAAIMATAVDASREIDAVVRERVRWAPRLARAAVPAPAAERAGWPLDGATLITGGLGDLGLAVARHLVAQGVRRLILLARTPLPHRSLWQAVPEGSRDARRIAAVLELEASGASVHCESIDVGDAGQLAAFFEAYRAELWPPIVAVVHTAGVIDSHLVRSMSPTSMDRVFQGKVRGAWLLHRAFPDVRRFVLFSSTSVLIPQAGEANYAAANAFLDSLAALRRSIGQEAQVINWGVWRNSGVIANDEGARYVDEVRRQGIDSMDPSVAVDVFGRLTAAGVPQMFVAPVAWDRLRQTRGAVHLGPVFERLAGDEDDTGRADVDAFVQQLGMVAPGDRHALLEERLREMAAQVLGVQATRLRTDATLGSQGLDSLMALELRNHIEGAFDLKVSATLAWNYPTLAKLSAHLLAQLAGRLDDAQAATEPVEAAAVMAIPVIAMQTRVDDLAGISEDDILRELRGGR